MLRLFLFSLVSFSQTTLAMARDAVVSCRSFEKVEGWTGGSTNDFVYFTAYVSSDTELSKAAVKGAYLSDSRELSADRNYSPRSPAYRNYYRFSVLEDAWHWFAPLLPKQLLSQNGPFTGYLQINGEEGYKGTLRLRCSIIAGR